MPNGEASERARAIEEHQETRLLALEQRLELLRQRQALLRQRLERLQSTQSAATSLLAGLEKLQLYNQEVQWRIADQTLSAQLVPTQLNSRQLNRQQQDTTRQRGSWEEESSRAQAELEKLQPLLLQTQQAVQQTRLQKDLASQRTRMEMDRQNLTQALQGQGQESLRHQLGDLKAEKAWLAGAFTITQDSFEDTQTSVTKLEQQLQATTSPVPPATPASSDSYPLETASELHGRAGTIRRPAGEAHWAPHPARAGDDRPV